MEIAMKPKFGYLMEINRDDYVREVNEAPKGNYSYDQSLL